MIQDHDLCEQIILQFAQKPTAIPYRCFLPEVTSDGMYAIRRDRRVCALGIVLDGTKHCDGVYADAARLLGVSVVTAIGIAMGFDGGPLLYPISHAEETGIKIGAAVSKQLLDKRPASVVTAAGHTKDFWP